MYIDARHMTVVNRRADAELVRLVRAELQPLEERLQRVQLRVLPDGGELTCQLLAWSERGQTICIEKRAGSATDAALLAVGSLKRALLRPWSSTLSAVKQSSGHDSSEGRATLAPHAPATAPQAPPESGRPERVLLALHELDPSAPSVHWAQVLAGGLGAPLDVCRVVEGVSDPAYLPPGPQWLSATRQLLAEGKPARAWCNQALPHGELADRVVPGGQGYVERMASLARQRGASWVIVPAGKQPNGSLVVELARRAGCPVLVSRAPMSRCTLLVVAESEGANHAVSRRAARLARAFHAPVMAFHNLESLSPDSVVPPSFTLAEPWKDLQREAAEEHSEYRLPELEVLLAHDRDRVQAVLGQAQREDADMIVVGVSSEATPGSGLSEGLAASLVEHALRSVLVVPCTSHPMAERTAEVARVSAPAGSARLARDPGPEPRRSRVAAE